jgi:hypothetical protein
VVAMLAPWSASPPVHPLLDVTGGSTCALTTQTGTCDSVQWTIAPFAPGNPFGDFQSQPGTGASQPITITFSAPVGSATVTAVDPTFAGNQVVAYLAGVEISRQDFAFSGQPGVNIPDTKAIAGPLDRLDLLPAPADYVAYTASVTTSNRCEVTVTAYAQNDSRWANKKYDHLTAGDTTIGRWGCALTSLAMALTFAGHTVAPDSLNAFMIANEGFDASAVSWLATVPSFSSGGLEWVDLPRTNSPAELATAVCSGNPVIVYVPSLVTTRQDGTPGSHFVLVTGGPREATDSTSLGEFSIVDPNPASGATTLDPYGSFVLRGYPGTGAQQGTLAGNAMIGSVTAADASQRRLQFITVGGTLLVTDPQGRRVGQEAPGGSIISEIPGALFDRDETPDHHEAAVTTAPQVARVTLPEAASGVYRIDFSATTSIPNAMVRVRAELADRRIVTNSASLSVTAGAVYTFDVAYDRDSSTAPILTPTLPGWAPNVQYSLGDQVSFQGLDYECRQAHTSQVGWEPPMVYALWARINAGETWAPQVLYETGQEVSYQGVRYRALQGHQSQPGWEPPHVPALWTVAN